MRPPSRNALLLAAALAAVSGIALAKSSDRNALMNIESNASTCSLGDNMNCTLTGNVVITQGTLRINAARGDITQANGRPQRGKLSGGVTMNQTMDDGTPVSTKSAGVDYDFNSEVIILTGGVVITQPRGTLRGERVVYNMRNGQVQSGGQGAGRVKMTIQPKAGG